jgi:hypothetical protein
MARDMVTLYRGDLAREIVVSLMNDAMKIGESRRARLWRQVLWRIRRIEKEDHARLN